MHYYGAQAKPHYKFAIKCDHMQESNNNVYETDCKFVFNMRILRTQKCFK